MYIYIHIYAIYAKDHLWSITEIRQPLIARSSAYGEYGDMFMPPFAGLLIRPRTEIKSTNL